MKEGSTLTDAQNNEKKRKRSSSSSLSDIPESNGDSSSKARDDKTFLRQAEIPAHKKTLSKNQIKNSGDAIIGAKNDQSKEVRSVGVAGEEESDADGDVTKVIVRPYAYRLAALPEETGVTAHLEVVFLASDKKKAASIRKKRRTSDISSSSRPVELVPAQTLETLREERLSDISEWLKTCTLTIHQGHIMANAFVKKYQDWFTRGDIYDDLIKIMKKTPKETMSMEERKRLVYGYIEALPLEDWSTNNAK